MAFNSRGTRAYVTNQLSHSVSVIDVATGVAVNDIAVEGNPFVAIVGPSDRRLLVTTNADRVYVINLASRPEGDRALLRFTSPSNGLALSRDGRYVYVSTLAGEVAEVELDSNVVRRVFAVGGVAQGLGVSPDGDELYVANEASDPAGGLDVRRIAFDREGTVAVVANEAGWVDFIR